MVGHLNKMRDKNSGKDYGMESSRNGIKITTPKKKKDGEINKVLHDLKKLKVKNWTRLVKG
jgi:hypothetical protein